MESFQESVGDLGIEPVEDELSHLEESGSDVLDMFEYEDVRNSLGV